MRNRNAEKGLLTLEACMSLTMFIFLMLYMYSFMTLFEARNQIAHVLLASTDSLALDMYDNSPKGNMTELLRDIYNGAGGDENGFTNSQFWARVRKDAVVTDSENDHFTGTIYAATPVDDDPNNPVEKGYAVSNDMNTAIRNRFVAYMGDGSETKADQLLNRINIIDGLDGLDFSKSYLASGKLYVIVQYSIKLEFNLFGKSEYAMQQSCCSKIWK